MKNIPKIKIKKDLKMEIKMFQEFLHHPYYPQNRNFIFQVFPEIETQLKKTKNEKKVIKEFIANFYKIHRKIINQIIKKNIIINKKMGEKFLKS